MKQVLIAIALFVSSSMMAQELMEVDSVKMVKDAEKELKVIQKDVSDATQSVKKAEQDYKNAQKKYHDLRSQKMQAENEMEQARIQLRKARLAQVAEQKRLNPEIIERYEVIMHPVFEEMSLGTHRGLSVFLQGSEEDGLSNLLSKNADGELRTYLKSYDSDKVKRKKGELFFDNISIPEMSMTPMDLYAVFDEQDGGVNMKLFFNTGTGFIDFQEDTSATSNAKNIFDTFARYMRQKELEERVDAQEKDLKKLQKDLEGYQKDIVKAKEDINKSETEIAEKRGELSSTESQIDQLLETLDKTRKLLSKVQ